jgi:hypothetical protein
VSAPVIICLVLGVLLIIGIVALLIASSKPDYDLWDQLRRDAAPYDTEIMDEAFDEEHRS